MRPEPHRQRLIPILIFCAVVLTFGAVFTNDFVTWDDVLVIAGNPRFNPPTLEGVFWYWTNSFELYVPVTYTLWGALAWLGQLDSPDASGSYINPWLFHATSVLLHATSALVVFMMLKRLCERPWPACAGALLFALHPVQAESVAWAAGMKDVLAGLLALVALWVHFQSAKPRPPVAVFSSAPQEEAATPRRGLARAL